MARVPVRPRRLIITAATGRYARRRRDDGACQYNAHGTDWCSQIRRGASPVTSLYAEAKKSAPLSSHASVKTFVVFFSPPPLNNGTHARAQRPPQPTAGNLWTARRRGVEMTAIPSGRYRTQGVGTEEEGETRRCLRCVDKDANGKNLCRV